MVFRSAVGKQLGESENYNKSLDLESEVYKPSQINRRNSSRRSRGLVRKVITYAVLGAGILALSMYSGCLKKEDITGAYNKIKSMVVGQETPGTRYETLDNKVEVK